MAGMPSPHGTDKKQRHRRRPSKPAVVPNAPPAKIVADALKVPVVPPPSVEEPLSPEEVTRLKAHFKFLRDNRQLLKLRVNAAEDLLLNGVKEPTHRGVCQHLLAKVERSRVLTVSQNLAPEPAVKLLSGIIRFSPDIVYVLRYLECVKLTASQQQASAALTEALKQIEFASLSAAQMRQLVALIVDVFPERDLPIFFYTLFHDRAFKDAIDRSLEGFPEVLGRMVRPLRLVYEMTAYGTPHHVDFISDLPALKNGVALLLDANSDGLAQLHDNARMRLLQLGCQVLRARYSLRVEGLLRLFAGGRFSSDSDRAGAALSLAQSLIAASEEGTARRFLDREVSALPNHPELKRLLTLLDSPRLGFVAFDGGPENARLPAPGRWHRGWHLLTREAVLARHASKNEAAFFADQVALWKNLLLPGVARVVESRLAETQAPYFAVELPGASLVKELKQAQRVSEHKRLELIVQICAVLQGLAQQGLLLADVDLNRFNVDAGGRVWLVDLWPMACVEPAHAQQAYVENMQKLGVRLLGAAPAYSLPDDVLEQISATQSLQELAALIAGRAL